MEFQAYIVRTHALRKVFVSVKGFYFQAEVQQQLLTWLVPHQLSQARHSSGTRQSRICPTAWLQHGCSMASTAQLSADRMPLPLAA